VVAGIATAVEALPEGRRVTLAAASLDGGPAMARAVRIRLRDTDTQALQPGDTLRVRALLRPPAAPAYPGGWDMQRDAWFDGMGGYGFAIGPAERLGTAAAGNWQTLRQAVAGRVMAALPGARGAIAATLLTGLGAAIPAEDRAAFQASGLAHLLAVAGLHIGIVMGLVFALVRTGLCVSEHAALHWPVKRIAATAAVGGGLLYLGLTGGHIPILRSFAMACLVLLAVFTGRRAISVRALALAALLLMVWRPWLVMGVSFQMSFAAVLALVAGWQACTKRLALLGAGRWWRAPVLYVGGLALTSALAGTASLPYAGYHFGTANVFYVPANMLAVPLTALWVLPCGIAALALMPVGLERLALWPMGVGVDGLLMIARTVAAWPGAVRPLPQMPAGGLLLVSAGLVWCCVWRSRLRLAGAVPLLAGLVSPWLVAAPDLVVGPGARVIAARVGGVAVMRVARGAGRFELENPARVWGVGFATPLPADGTAASGAVRCAADACRLVFANGRAALVAGGAEADCAGAPVVVLAMSRRDVALRGACVLVVDRSGVLRDGATAIYVAPHAVTVLTDHAARGERPWVIPYLPARTLSRLPPALTE
jgi:competence protein ComEC